MKRLCSFAASALLLGFAAATLRAQTIGEVPSAFSYQGYLQNGGAPASGSHDFRFELYDFAVNGNKVGPTVDVNGVAVSNGVFTVSLDFGNTAGSIWDGARWLRIQVRPTGAGAYTELTPRTKLFGAPYAMGLSTPLDVVDAYGGALLTVKNEQDVGSPTGIWGEVLAETGSAIAGRATAATGENRGVYGVSSSANGAGVLGRVTAPGDLNGFSSGVLGESTTASGISYGVQGTAASPAGYAVYGLNTATTGTATGILGRTHAEGGRGVYGAHNATTGAGAGVYGTSPSTAGRGVHGVHSAASGDGAGVFGQSSSSAGQGVHGQVTVGGSSSILSSAGVYGESTTTSGFTYGVVGAARSASGYGVFGRNNAAGGYAAYFFNQVRINDALMLHNGTGADPTIIIDAAEGTGGLASIKLRSGGTNVIELDADHNGDGRVITQELEITGGSDLSETFDVSPAFGVDVPLPGMVVSIDPAAPGKLRLSGTAYDPLVAGIVSGAGEVETGLIMGQEGSVADGDYPVALVGRVYVLVDAGYGAVRPGDLLTTSETPGHAMRVLDRERAAGAVLGKAMTALASGRGLVLVLVSLQ